MSHTNNKAGQTIIEAVIALASIMLTLGAISIAVTTSVSNSNFIKSQTLAGKYAQAGMEHMRYSRNTDPSSFESREGLYCMMADNSFAPGSCPGVNLPGNLKREAEFTQDTIVSCDGGTKVAITVYWSSGKCSQTNTFCHKSELISCFADQSDQGTEL